MTGTGQQVGRFPLDVILAVDEAREEQGGHESRIEWILNAVRMRLGEHADRLAEAEEER